MTEKLLQNINSPDDLKKLPESQLQALCGELRRFIIDAVSDNPAHLGANLGAVELTVALHYIFDTPDDKLIWDVGHQAYGHKILTGRRDRFESNRKRGGISGFPKMDESEYDAFGVGHASTSISAALGMAEASQRAGNTTRHHIAVIGDGAMTGGMALEAMNNAGVNNPNLLVILNDNGIAIDKNVGAIKDYLAGIATSPFYNRLKDKVWLMLGGGTKYGHNTRAIVKQVGNAVKGSILRRSNLFEAFNFRYFGPVDGNDVERLVKLLRDIKNIKGPKLLHIVTTKGKGLELAEREPVIYHAPPGKFDRLTGRLVAKKPCDGLKPPKYQVVFGRTMIELAESNPKVLGITAAMPTGTSLDMLMNKMPNRAFDVGIAEQHAVTFAAGLATQGFVPFCVIYSSFLQRAYDQIIHDVALQNLNVVFCIDRAGVVGEDGATHQGSFDLAYLRCVPNMTICAPMNEQELRNMMFTAQLTDKGPWAIRYPRGRGVMKNWKTPFGEIASGTGRKLTDGNDLAILSIGHIGNEAAKAVEMLREEEVEAAHYDVRFLKPLDEKMLHEVFKNFKNIITVEDGVIAGGFGSAVLEFMADHRYSATVVRLGIPDRFVEHGDRNLLIHELGYDAQAIAAAARKLTAAFSPLHH
ncbi:MAG: 1-deoxy-D-xylulose-5-phosphate synthase [Bacteroidales bacterium]|jgi:1-deoxy-D-xylulose-5-phosphate synthase|nr:1-deoxy-D-xylulose-5-phosphate synthase [Bacteroidales bacterium]MDD2631390.1 1-deoxy-D-xylulose-5-phosphate synthase [Bacteroidales bacterium]MDD3525482.1 1-deoxy-D-xylulose-5-phosphate synthase [Bacteroidales bacterium]MDD4175870.1 1-deoxy-D-xylulose-5-phosphate synthase [Bacteroidales bacterium]MDD4740023.1 1-deoxy-D-xylulose-5-phosphate synthase [Bacteroidales bacterium]